MSTILIAVYWGARADSLAECSSNLQAHFRSLAVTSDALKHWHSKAWKRPKEPKEVDVGSLEAASALLSKGVNRRDTDKSIIAELGWSISLWNGDLGGVSASTSAHCNCTSPRVGNSALLEVSRDEGEPLSIQTAVEQLKRLIDIWRPDEGVVKRSLWNEELQQREETELASYSRSRWPKLFAKGSERYSDGLLRLDF